MGRRSINTTKNGKHMNPTDRARKQARRKELKKNKKNRELVRAAVLKGKDPLQMIEEMEKIDQMEYNVLQPPVLNEKVLQDKRKKLKGNLDRLLKIYAKDDQEKFKELREQLLQYERRRVDLATYFEAVKYTQQVKIDEIPLPLPNLSMPRSITGPLTSKISLLNMPQPPSIINQSSVSSNISNTLSLIDYKNIPGVPPFPSPDLSEDEDLCDKSKDVEQKQPLQQQHSITLIGMPPPLPPRIGLRLPPGPPPGMSQMLRPGVPTLLQMPPTQVPLSKLSHLSNLSNFRFPIYNNTMTQQKTPNILSAMPQLINHQGKDRTNSTIIEAKPQMRNLAADATRFIPASLRAKRNDEKKPNRVVRLLDKNFETPIVKPVQSNTKDESYLQFMREMQGLL